MQLVTVHSSFVCGVRVASVACFKSHDTKSKQRGAFVYPSLTRDGAHNPTPITSNVTPTWKREGMTRDETTRDNDTLARRRRLETALLKTLPPTDYAVWVKRGDVRVLAAIVRKTGSNIFFRRTTQTVGLGALHIVNGKTKKLPEKLMRRIVGARDTDTVYMLTVRECVRYEQRQNREGIRECSPHDRRPQVPNLPGRKPRKGKSDFVPVASMWYYEKSKR